jgi:hypothetical protein
VSRPHVVVLLALASVALVALGLHLWGIVGDLPYAPDVDEPIFLKAAVGMLQRRSLNPEWFGHPASTLIYPMAALIELWYQVAKHVPFAHPMSGIGRELLVDPTPFYIIGRLVSVGYGVGCIVATWLLARRVVGDVGGILAAILLPATSIVVLYGQLIRDDMAGLFFALIALWLTLRAMDGERTRNWVLSAFAIGLAISTRYFYAALVVPYCVAAWLWYRSARDGRETRTRSRRSWAIPLVALPMAVVGFVITTPFAVLDLPKVITDLRGEAASAHPGADGLTPIGNLAWYVGQVIPATFGPLLLVLALAGVFVVARRNPNATTVLVAFATSYLVAVSASPLHWERYAIPLVPVVGIFVAGAVLFIANLLVRVASIALARRGGIPSPGAPDVDANKRRRPLVVGVASLIVVALLLPSLSTVAAADRLRASPSTRVVATEWIKANLPPASRIAEEMYTAYLDGTGNQVLHVFSLGDRSIDAYRAAGYRYLVMSSSMVARYQDAGRYPTESAFYRTLDATARLLSRIQPGPDRAGPEISIFEIVGT